MPFILLGCWDSVETEKLGVVTSIGVELSDNNNIKVTIQQLSHKSQTAGNQSPGGVSQKPFYVNSEVAPTITEAIQKISSNQHQKIYFGHTKVIILDEELVNSKGIQFIIDFYERIPEMTPKTWLLISKNGQLDKILNTNTGLNLDTGSIIEETISNEKDNSYLTVNNLKDFIEMLTASGGEAYTSGINILPKDSTSKTSDEKFTIKDTAVFKNDKLIGWLKNEESRGLSLANGNVKGGFMSVPFEDNTISLKILKVNSKIYPVMTNEKMQINLNLDVLSNISESHVKSNFLNKDTIGKIEQLENEKIKKEINSALDRSKNLNSDVFQLGSYFNMSYPDLWKKNKNNWNSYYPNVQVNIHVNTTIKNIGNTYKTLK
jgi:spore germination protein KC